MNSKEAWELLQELPPSWSQDYRVLPFNVAANLNANGLVSVAYTIKQEDFTRPFSIDDYKFYCRRSEKGDEILKDPLKGIYNETAEYMPPDEAFPEARRLF